MRRHHRLAVAVALGAATSFVLLFAPPARAVPNYSRRYDVACTTCHTTWGALTGAGVTFRLSGYRAINGRDLKPVEKDIELGNGALTLPGTFPVSIITGAGLDGMEETRKPAAGGTFTRAGTSIDVEDASFFLTAPLGKHLAAFIEFPMFENKGFEFTPTGPAQANLPLRGNVVFASESPVFEVAKFWWNSLIPGAPRDSVNLLFGITHPPLAYASGKVRLSVNQYLVFERRALDLISGVPLDAFLFPDQDERLFRLAEPQGLFEVNGMVVPSGQVTDVGKRDTFWLEYHVGVSNGSNPVSDNNTEKDLYLRLVGRWYNQSLGFFAYWSPETYDGGLRASASIANGGIMSGLDRKNGTLRVGPDTTLSLVPAGIPLWLENCVLYNKDSDPTGFNRSFAWWGGLHQLNWQIQRIFIAYGRYDWIRGDRYDDTAAGGVTAVKPSEWDVVGGLQYLVLENLKLVLEGRHRVFEDKATATNHPRLTENNFTFRAMTGF